MHMCFVLLIGTFLQQQAESGDDIMMVCPAPARLAAPVPRAVQHCRLRAECSAPWTDTLPVGSQCVHHSVTAKERNGLLNL